MQVLPRQGKNLTLTVALVSNPLPEPRNIAQAEPPAAPASTAAPNVDGRITEKARFLVAPDLSSLEHIAVPVSGSLTVRLHVSSLGSVDRAELVKGDPVPRELLDGLLEKLRQTRLTPARAESKAVASNLDLVIRYEAGPGYLPRNP